MVRAAGHDPDDRWIGGYVDCSWAQNRHVIEVREKALSGRRVLEFGCNYGATAIVLAALGARVVGVDSDIAVLQAARENVARYGFEDRVALVACARSGDLPFGDAAFDIVVCNSVLEYVDHHMLANVQREIDRVLRAGGRIYVTGTSNRLSPYEIHSRRWLVNYLPLRGRGGRERQRGVWPWQVRYGFGNYENLDWRDGGRAYVEARRRIRGGGVPVARVANTVARCFGVSLGLLTPSLSMTLEKREAR
jgi:SAM-dependent methyltransferase